MPKPFHFPRIAILIAISLPCVPSVRSAPGLETSHATHSVGGGKFVFVMHVDYSSKKHPYKGSCYSVTEKGLAAAWKLEGWYAYHGNLLLSEDGTYLVRIDPTMKEVVKNSDHLGSIPCLRVYENGKLLRTYKLSDLVKDLSKVIRGPELNVMWHNGMMLQKNMLKIQTIDGEDVSIDLTKK